jgi:hypothetical protein
MQAMLNPKPSDDPHDIVMIAPDAVRVAPADEEIESLLKNKVRAPAEPPLHAAPDLTASATVPPAGATVPPVDTTFRATAANDILIKSRRRSMAGRVLRGVAALLLAACIGGAAMAWRYHGEAAQQMIAEWAPLFAQKSSQPPEKTGLTAAPVLAAAEVDAANASPVQPATAAQTAAPAATAETAASAPAAAAAPDEPQSLETMARDLASASQQIEQLKASVEQLKASQQQLVAMVSDKAATQNLRPKKPASPPRPVAAFAPARTTAPPPPLPPRPYRPAAAPIMSSSAAAPLPPAGGPYMPRPVEPQSRTAAETLDDPELVSVPRPPMPLR